MSKQDTRKVPLRANHLLLPTLFDRLRDDAPNRRVEAPSEYAVTRNQMREIIQRDLAFLFNTMNLGKLLDAKAYPAVATSTLNYGMPPLTGSHQTEAQWQETKKKIKSAIENYEPRILPATLEVEALQQEKGTRTYNILSLAISGQIAMNPYPMEFVVQSSVDLETARMMIKSLEVR